MFLIEMSKGSPVVTVRIPDELLELMDEIIARSAATRKESPWSRSSFIIAAIEEKIEKMARSAGWSSASTRPALIRRGVRPRCLCRGRVHDRVAAELCPSCPHCRRAAESYRLRALTSMGCSSMRKSESDDGRWQYLVDAVAAH